MNTRAQRFGWMPIALGAFVLTVVLAATGRLAPLERAATDSRARLLQQEVASDIVIVGIDAPSLADLRQWPWPRRYHARLLDRLADAGARQVFLDIDFSAHTSAEDDAALADALARFTNPVMLPAFLQRGLGADRLLLSQPQEAFAKHARLASVNLQPGADTLVREVPRSIATPSGSLPSVALALSAKADVTAAPLPIDFSIAPSSFQYLSYVDVLAGRVHPDDLRGKTVFVGATAVELNDMLPVPVHRSLPGVIVLALATESALALVPTTLSKSMQMTILGLIVLVASWGFARRPWRRNAAILLAALTALAALHVLAFALARFVFPLAPAVLAVTAVFCATTLRALDEQTWRAVTYALGLRRRDALLRSVVEASGDAILCIDASGSILTANAAGARLFGAPSHRLVDTPIGQFIPTLGEPLALSTLAGSITELSAVRGDGTRLPAEISVSPVSVRGESLYTVIVRDCTERKAQQDRLQHQALHDALTGLGNRTALSAHLDARLAETDASLAVLMLDLCRFKEVNDTLGHGIGDQVLCEVARRFEQAVPGAFIARVGGDEFTVVLHDARHPDHIGALAARLSESLLAPIVVANIATDIGVSIGIACYPADADDAPSLLRRADVAMYESKRLSSRFEFYDAARDQHTIRKLAMVGELRAAIADGQLALHYQPQVDLRTGRSSTVEALLRWRHPAHGIVSPGEFITIAESTDLIHALTEWSIHEALSQSRRWQLQGFTPRIAVNLSARVLQDVSFPHKLAALLLDSGASPALLELEITESAMMLDASRALRVTREVHDLGVLLSIDDFGTGFSSLGYLRDLPVHALKLDRSFVMNLHQRAGDRVIVDSTVQMAHALRMQVVAEGVENAWTADYLRNAGFDYAQGFHFTRALPADQCAHWMAAFNAPVLDSHSLVVRDSLATLESSVRKAG